MWLRFKEAIKPVLNKQKLDYLGISAFHKKGYKGAGIKIASRESDKTTHGAMVADILKQIAPDADIVLKENYQKGTDADIYTTSSFYASDTYKQHKETAAKLYGEDVLLCCAVGNEGDSSQTELSKNECWTSIGACDLENSIPKRMYYSSITPDLDFVSLTNMETKDGKFTGTSCATPLKTLCMWMRWFLQTLSGVLSTKLMPVHLPSSTFLMKMVSGTATSFSSSTKRLYDTIFGNKCRRCFDTCSR